MGPTLAGEKSGLIPRKVLFGNPDKASPRISPDGKQLSYLAPVDGVMNVWVGTDRQAGRCQTGNPGQETRHSQLTSGLIPASTYSISRTKAATRIGTSTALI